MVAVTHHGRMARATAGGYVAGEGEVVGVDVGVGAGVGAGVGLGFGVGVGLGFGALPPVPTMRTPLTVE